MIPEIWLHEAVDRLSGKIIQTPLTYDPALDAYFKWENQQRTGSFKLRGALNKILTLQRWELERGLVAASAGNHGQGVALAGGLSGATVTIFASENAVPAKLQAMRGLGAQVRLVGGDYGAAEQAGLAFAISNNATWISPYNDGQVIAGQGTLALEVLGQLQPSLSDTQSQTLTWIVPVGGGGLLAGIACALFAVHRQGQILHRIVAVQSEASPFFHEIYWHGTQEGVRELTSLADGLAGPVEAGSLTIPILRRYLSDFLLVSETAIQQAIGYAWQHYQQKIEGSAAAALAALLSGQVTARPALVVISGGNIQPEVHQQIISQPAQR
jgi:threonine dehydratase